MHLLSKKTSNIDSQVFNIDMIPSSIATKETQPKALAYLPPQLSSDRHSSRTMGNKTTIHQNRVATASGDDKTEC
jgi:hypothetical protein